ncbi:MAG: ribonuclease P protein subunit [Nanoarchaeota archaeon]|nr:ribonuclease P protein subunit [Nanoarchaeota archaeon]
MRTSNNILRHELIGLEIEVVEAKNKDLIGLKGKVVDETQFTIVIATKKGEKKVLKMGTQLKTKIADEEIIIMGDSLVGRPEDRIKK